jgi:hypothetical protein
MKMPLSDAAKPQEFKAVSSFLPTTFLERGVAVPFTTPILIGARARPGERKPLELIVPNPSGGRGVYILPWDGISGLCRPTVHDRRLSETVAMLRGVTPQMIRHTAREVAAEGLAGRGALTAARSALRNEQEACMQANYDLLLHVVRQIEPKGENRIPPEQDRPAEIERRAKRAVARIAPSLCCSPEVVVERLEQLALVFSSVGVGRNSARIPAAIANIVRVRNEMMQFAERSDDNGAEADLIASAADLTILMAKETFADTQLLAHDISVLLSRWVVEPDVLAQLLARPDWLLDGWDLICALWDIAPEVGTTIAEMAVLVPVVPREADAWLSQRLGLIVDLPQHRSRMVQPMEDWRTGTTVCDVIARNESLLEKTI